MTQPGSPAPVLRYLRAALGPDADGPADAELLGRFVAERDQGAFELLVWRHAGMVHRVCRGVLRDHHAAEDVAQAAFLVLARKAGGIGRRQAVAAWLYRVAYRLAVRVAARRRPPEEANLDRLPTTTPPDAGPDPEAVRLLHDELARLPEKYRAPVLLCFFDGLSHADAARRLGWPVGTVAGRIARAKEWLHDRLNRRGVTIPAAGLAALAGAEPAVAASFPGAMARAAAAFAAGQAVVPEVSITVLELAKGAIRTMTVTKLQWATGVLAACGALTVGGVWATAQGPGTGPADPQPATAAPSRPASSDPSTAGEPAERRSSGSQRKRSMNNIKQILLAFHNHHDAYGYLPADIRGKDGKPLLSWRVAILPFIEQDNLYRQFKLDQPWDSEHNLKLLAQLPNVYRVGIEPKDATHTYYQVFAGPGTPFDPNPPAAAPGGEGGLEGAAGGAAGTGVLGTPGGLGGAAPPPSGGPPGLGDPAAPQRGGAAPTGPPRVGMMHITDGTSNTFGVVEAGPPVAWTKPADIPFDPKKPFPKLVGPFTDALHVGMLDGSARAIGRGGLDYKVLTTYVTANDGQVNEDLDKLRAPWPAVTPEEKAMLKHKIAENQKLIEEIDRLMKEYSRLLGGKNQGTGDLFQAEEMTERLRQIVEELRQSNRQLRGEHPVPKDAPRKPVKD
jgi:RNA polymerase sigma factor (sigma-70 family)